MTERSNKKKYPLCAAALALAVLLAGCAPAEGAAAATAQPTAEPTEAPTPTPEPEANPLTGEQGDYTNQRPVAVSIRTGDGSTPQWGIAAADVLIEGVTEGKTAGLTAVFASVDSVEKAGPVAPGRDLPLQLVLPLNAVPVHINKSVYASNLLNVLQYQDLDGYHAGTAGFAFDEDRANSGYREENCWYTTKDLINTGLATYNTDTAGANMPLFHFVQRKDPEQQNAKSLYITFSNKDTEELVYSPEVGLYLKNNADGSPMMDAGNNEQAAFTNVFVLYASSGVKDDGVTRQYDLTGGTGIYLTKGGWETIQWTKGDATAPLQLTDASGKTLDVNPGKSFLAIWGGYYGQALRLLDGDGNEQALPEKPALLDSAVPDEAAEAAELEQQRAQALADAQKARLGARRARVGGIPFRSAHSGKQHGIGGFRGLERGGRQRVAHRVDGGAADKRLLAVEARVVFRADGVEDLHALRDDLRADAIARQQADVVLLRHDASLFQKVIRLRSHSNALGLPTGLFPRELWICSRRPMRALTTKRRHRRPSVFAKWAVPLPEVLLFGPRGTCRRHGGSGILASNSPYAQGGLIWKGSSPSNAATAAAPCIPTSKPAASIAPIAGRARPGPRADRSQPPPWAYAIRRFRWSTAC